MDLQTVLTWLFMDKFLSSVTPRIFIWSAKGIWQPATLTVARLEWLWARWRVRLLQTCRDLGPCHLHRNKHARSQYSVWGYRDRACSRMGIEKFLHCGLRQFRHSKSSVYRWSTTRPSSVCLRHLQDNESDSIASWFSAHIYYTLP